MAENSEVKSTREPVQKRSIEKKERIIEAGFKLMCQQGYHGTNTAQIAKAAGVSTGIIYQYFKDKHEIFLEGTRRYSNQIFFPVLDAMDFDLANKGLKTVICQLVDNTIDAHKVSNEAHELIMSLIHTDPEIAEIFHEVEFGMTEKITQLLVLNGFKKEGLVEKVHIAVDMVDDLCHDMIFHNHSTIDYTLMKEYVIEAIYNLVVTNQPENAK